MHADSQLKIPIGLLNDLYDARCNRDVLLIFAKWFARIVPADLCGIALQSGPDHLIATTMSEDGSLDRSQKYRIRDSLLGAVFESQSPLMIADLAKDPHPASQELASQGLGTLMMVPILIRGRCFGTLAFSLTQGQTPGPTDFDLIQGLGRCLASQLTVIERIQGLTDALTTDTLTKARNRRFYGSVVDQLWGEWMTEQVPFALVLIDIDHFKHINDTHGHSTGDQILCAFVNRLVANVRTDDKVVRLGGEEFAIALAAKQIPEALAVANRLHAVIRDTPFSADGMALNLTASFGLTEVGPLDLSHRDVFDRADKALYQAKHSGRDTIIPFFPAPSELASIA